MEEIDVQKLPRKELLQLCAENNIRTAGVKQDELVRLLQSKLHPPAADSSRFSTKTRSQISTNSPIRSPRGKEKSTEKTLPTPGLTSQRRGLHSLVLVDDPSLKVSPESSPRKNRHSPNPAVLPRKPIETKPNTPPAQRSDLLRKKVNALTAVGKLQAQERSRLVQQSDGSSVRGRNNVAAAAPTGKQAQDRQPQRSDGAFVRSRSSSTIIGAPKKSIRSASMEPVTRPGTGERVKRNEASRFKAQTSPKLNAAYLEAAAKRSHPRASEGATSATAAAGSRSDFNSQNFDSVSEIATDAGHHVMSEDSDADDGRSVTSVASEPASRFVSQFHSPRAIEGSKLGRGESPLRNSAHGRSSSFDSSKAPEGKGSDPSKAENLISPLFLEDDTAFNFVGDTHEHEIHLFLNADIVTPEEINAAEGSHQVQDFEQARTAEISTTDCQREDILVSEESLARKQDAGNSMGAHAQTAGHSESAPKDSLLMDILATAPVEEIRASIQLPEAEDENSVPHSIELSHPEESPATFSDEHERKTTEDSVSETSQSTTEKDILLSKNNINAFEADEGHILTNTEKGEGDGLIESTHNEESPNDGDISPTANVQLVSDQRSPLHQESPDSASAPSTNDLPRSGKDSITSSAESREIGHRIFDTAPRPHPDMERSAITPLRVDLPQSSSMLDDFDAAGGQNQVTTLRSPCDELQQDFEIKLRRDYNKDGSKKNTIVDDTSVKVPLLQQEDGKGKTHVIKRSFPLSILHWCSQLFSAIFGTRNQC